MEFNDSYANSIYPSLMQWIGKQFILRSFDVDLQQVQRFPSPPLKDISNRQSFHLFALFVPHAWFRGAINLKTQTATGSEVADADFFVAWPKSRLEYFHIGKMSGIANGLVKIFILWF